MRKNISQQSHFCNLQVLRRHAPLGKSIEVEREVRKRWQTIGRVARYTLDPLSPYPLVESIAFGANNAAQPIPLSGARTCG